MSPLERYKLSSLKCGVMLGPPVREGASESEKLSGGESALATFAFWNGVLVSGDRTRSLG